MKTFLLTYFLIPALSFAGIWKASGQAQLVELYTSEGCSSCPPADKWISGLKSHPGLWTKFVPLSYHVNYWDRLGWTDKFAAQEFTDRQREYARSWGSGRVYTPEIVIQGLEASTTNSFSEVKPKLETSWDGESLKVIATDIPEGSIVHYAWLGLGIKSEVKRGENAGSTLSHEFVVLKSGELGNFKSGQAYNLSKPSRTPEPTKALAVWIEKNGRPLVAAGNPL